MDCNMLDGEFERSVTSPAEQSLKYALQMIDASHLQLFVVYLPVMLMPSGTELAGLGM